MAGIWYRAGTVSVTNGSKKVTGFGSQWKTTTYKPDKGHTFWGPDGKAYEIDYVESDTALYLVTVYAGVTAASQAYSIDITRTSTIPAFSRELSAQLAFAQAQYDSWQQVLTGSGMVTLTAPDGQQVQVPALSAFQPTSASLQALQALVPGKDKLPVFNSATGADLVTLTAFIRTLLDDVNAAAALSTLDIADLYKKRNILGPVSQSGGIPTGAIIERGSNANGEYVKFADGTLVCVCPITVDFAVLANQSWSTDSSAFPHAFISQPAMSFSRVQRDWNPVNIRWGAQATPSAEPSVWTAYCIDTTGLSEYGGVCSYRGLAIGRWY